MAVKSKSVETALDQVVKAGIASNTLPPSRTIRLAAVRELAILRRKAKSWDSRFSERPGVLPGAWS